MNKREIDKKIISAVMNLNQNQKQIFIELLDGGYKDVVFNIEIVYKLGKMKLIWHYPVPSNKIPKNKLAVTKAIKILSNILKLEKDRNFLRLVKLSRRINGVNKK